MAFISKRSLAEKPMLAATTSPTVELPLRHAIFCAEPLERPNFFSGRLLSAEDLSAEQEYHRGKQRRHNRHCHGFGVVSGLNISIAKEPTGCTVVVEPGVAIDPAGNEIHLCEPAKLPLPESPAAIQIGIRFVERFCGSVAVASTAGTSPAWVQEGCEIVLESMAPSDGVLPVARLIRRGNAWRVDPKFKAPRAH